MTSRFQEPGDHTSFFKDGYFKNLKPKTPVVFGPHSYWLQYPRKNLILFQVSFCLSAGLPAKEFPLESFLALFGSWHECAREMKAVWVSLRRQVDVCLRCRDLPGLRVRHLCSSAGSPLLGLRWPGFLLHKVSVSGFVEQKAEQRKGPPHVDLASILFSYLWHWSFSGTSWHWSFQWAIYPKISTYLWQLGVCPSYLINS